MYATNAMIRNLQDRRKFDGKQFSEYLYRSDEAQEANLKAAEGRQPRKPDSHSHQNDNGDEDSEEEKEAEKQQQNSRCETCNKTYLSPKKEQQEFNDWCRSNYRSMAKPENFEHKYVVSCDPAAHCLKNVMVWGPEKLIQGGLEKLRCWDSSCEGHVQTQKKKKVIGIHDVECRRVEGMDDYGYIIFAKYRCKVCLKMRSGLELDALEAMGVPHSVLYVCPVIPFHDSCITTQLGDLIMEMMISPSGDYKTDCNNSLSHSHISHTLLTNV